jgi:hypothetical protein
MGWGGGMGYGNPWGNMGQMGRGYGQGGGYGNPWGAMGQMGTGGSTTGYGGGFNAGYQMSGAGGWGGTGQAAPSWQQQQAQQQQMAQWDQQRRAGAWGNPVVTGQPQPLTPAQTGQTAAAVPATNVWNSSDQLGPQRLQTNVLYGGGVLAGGAGDPGSMTVNGQPWMQNQQPQRMPSSPIMGAGSGFAPGGGYGGGGYGNPWQQQQQLQQLKQQYAQQGNPAPAGPQATGGTVYQPGGYQFGGGYGNPWGGQMGGGNVMWSGGSGPRSQ